MADGDEVMSVAVQVWGVVANDIHDDSKLAEKLERVLNSTTPLTFSRALRVVYTDARGDTGDARVMVKELEGREEEATVLGICVEHGLWTSVRWLMSKGGDGGHPRLQHTKSSGHMMPAERRKKLLAPKAVDVAARIGEDATEKVEKLWEAVRKERE